MIDLFGLAISFLVVSVFMLAILLYSIWQRDRDLVKLRMETQNLMFEWVKELQKRIEVLEKQENKQ